MTNQVTIEIQTSPGVWTPVKFYDRDAVTITRGRSDMESLAAPQMMTFTLDNRDGQYSPRNPMSPLYGKVGRNTPVRCTIDNGAFTRFYGEIRGIAPVWDEGHADNFIQVEAYGILRRLSKGQPTVSNGLRDWITSQSTLMAYFPLLGGEETTYSQNLAPGKTGSFSGRAGPVFTYGKDMGAAWLGTGMELNATGPNSWMQGSQYTAQGAHAAIDFVFQSPALGVLDVQLWPTWDSFFQLRLNTSGDAGTAQVSYDDGNGNVTTEPATGVIPALQDTQLHTCRLLLSTQAGPLIQYTAYIDGVQIDTGNTGLAQSLTEVPLFRFFYSRFVNQTVMNMAHIAVWSDNTLANIPSVTDYTAAAFAYQGELGLDRLSRVHVAGGIPLTILGTSSESPPMGPQFTETRLDQIRDVEATDMGILAESRGAGGLLYVSRASMYNRTPQFTLNYSAGQVIAPLLPVDDDQVTHNDVTATRREAGSDRYTVDTGPLSTQDPPLGVGRYETEVTVNPQTDGYLRGIAAWVANIGTLDRARWPSVSVNLNILPAALVANIKVADIGDRFVITGMQKAFVYDDVSLIIVGYTETITTFTYEITFNCMPAEPYTVGVYDTSRYDADGSTLTSNITSTATSLSATKSGTTLWTTDGTMFPFDIRVGGERMTVTNITGSTSPQTMTVTRSKNGVVKAQTAGAAIELWDTPRYAL